MLWRPVSSRESPLSSPWVKCISSSIKSSPWDRQNLHFLFALWVSLCLPVFISNLWLELRNQAKALFWNLFMSDTFKYNSQLRSDLKQTYVFSFSFSGTITRSLFEFTMSPTFCSIHTISNPVLNSNHFTLDVSFSLLLSSCWSLAFWRLPSVVCHHASVRLLQSTSHTLSCNWRISYLW